MPLRNTSSIYVTLVSMCHTRWISTQDKRATQARATRHKVCAQRRHRRRHARRASLPLAGTAFPYRLRLRFDDYDLFQNTRHPWHLTWELPLGRREVTAPQARRIIFKALCLSRAMGAACVPGFSAALKVAIAACVPAVFHRAFW